MKNMELRPIALPCPRCGRVLRLAANPAAPAADCEGCGESIPLAGGAALEGEAPARCHVCGSPYLFSQKDFNQKLGCLIVLGGAVLVPWTYGLSLPVVALIDLALYRLLPRVSVCYICSARYRGVRPRADHGAYDLHTAQAWEARGRNWTKGLLRPAFAPGEIPNGVVDPPGPGE